jgi:hypothetical protein
LPRFGSCGIGPGTAGGGVQDGGISVSASGTWLDALAAALGIAVVSIGALLYPVLRTGRAAAPVRRGRRAVLSRATARRPFEWANEEPERIHSLFIIWITFPYYLNNGKSRYTRGLDDRV